MPNLNIPMLPQPSSDDVVLALRQIEQALGILPPAGATELPPAGRFRATLMELRFRVCSHQAAVMARLESTGGELALIIADTLITSLSSVPLPVATVSTRIALIGLKRFCGNPAALLE